MTSTAAGPTENQAFGRANRSRLGRVRPATMSGTAEIANATATAIGTIAEGAENSSGTNASCVGTVKPSGVSKRTRVESARTSRETTAGTIGKASGSWIAQRPATAATRPAAERSTAMVSRRDIPEAERRSVSSSSS
jgi:hypothetical protein